eukprot:tig00021290_g19990.t1
MFQGECTHSDVITVVCGALFLISELLGGTERDSEGFWRLRLNQIPSDIDTLQIKGVYLELDTTAIPDPPPRKP